MPNVVPLTTVLAAAPAEAKRLNLGCGRNTMPGWVNVDQRQLPGVDVIADLNACRTTKLPFDDNSVDGLLLNHVLEHIPDSLALMAELYRIARPGAELVARVPYGSSDDAWEDPTHVRAYFAGSWGYFSQPFQWRADYQYTADWQPEAVTLVVGHRWAGRPKPEVLGLIHAQRNIVVEMIAVLRKVYPAREARRELQVPPRYEIEALPQ